MPAEGDDKDLDDGEEVIISTMTIVNLDTFWLYLMQWENDKHHIYSFVPRKVNVNVEMQASFGA